MQEKWFFIFAGIKQELEEMTYRTVDAAAYRENMNKFLKKRTDQESEYA